MSASNVRVVLAHGAWAGESHPRAPKLPPDHHSLIYLPETAFAAAAAPNATATELVVRAAVRNPLSPACIPASIHEARWRDLPRPRDTTLMAQRAQVQIRADEVDRTPMVSAPAVAPAMDIFFEAITAVQAH